MHTLTRCGMSIALALAVLIGACPAVHAKTSEPHLTGMPPGASQWTKEQAIAKARELFPELAHLPNADGELRTGEYLDLGRPSWSLLFLAASPSLERARIVLDANKGTLLHLSRHLLDSPSWESPPEALAKRAAAEFAARFAQDVLPRIAVHEVARGKGDSVSEYFSSVLYAEQVNGLSFIANRLSVDVDASGQIVGYIRQFNHAPSKFPSPEKLLTEEQIRAKLASHLRYSLEYHNPIALLYRPYLPQYLDGLTGDISNGVVPFRPPLVSAPFSVDASRAYQIRDEATLKQVLAALYRLPLQKLSVVDVTAVRIPPHDTRWRPERIYRWSAEHQAGEAAVLPTGQLLYVRHEQPPLSGGKPVTAEEGRAIALETLVKFLPRETKQLTEELQNRSNGMEPADRPLQYKFLRTHQDALVDRQRYLVSVDAQTGRVKDIDLSAWEPLSPNLPGHHMVLPPFWFEQGLLDRLSVRPVYGPGGSLLYEVKMKQLVNYVDAVNGTLLK